MDVGQFSQPNWSLEIIWTQDRELIDFDEHTLDGKSRRLVRSGARSTFVYNKKKNIYLIEKIPQ